MQVNVCQTALMLVNDYLLKEHDFITDFSTILKKEIDGLIQGHSPQAEKFKKIVRFCRDYVDHVHHSKEENILFEAIYPIKNIEGGPRCIYYKELQIQREPVVEQVKKIKKELGILEPDFYDNWNASVHQGCIVNPLLEEHILGRQLVTLIEHEAGQLVSGKTQSNQKLIMALYGYVSMIEEHIEKENTCFANTVDNYLPVSQQREIVRKFEELDSGECAPFIENCTKIMADLK